MPLKLYRRQGSEIWQYRGTVGPAEDRRRLRGSCRTTDKTIAERFISKIENREWTSHFDGPGAVLTFAAAAMLYRSAEKPLRFLETIENHWKSTLVKDITSEDIRQAARTLLPNAKAATRNRQIIVPTQAIINHAAKLKYCDRISVERFPVVKVEKTPATWEWVLAFMAHANPHLGALAAFMYLTAARITEALSVRWKDVDFRRSRVLIKQGKLGGEERWARMPPVLVIALAKIERKGETVFRYSSRDTAAPQWDKAIKRAGIERLSFHRCRHGFATGLLDRGVNPKTVAVRGGWKDVRHVFETYGHDVASEDVTDILTDTPGADKRMPVLNTLKDKG